MEYRIELLSAAHERSAFSSGSEPLDRYFHERVLQDVRRLVTKCFVAVAENREIAGYYTLSAAGVALEDLSAAIAKRLPRYPVVPAALVGRLAVAKGHQGRGLGAQLVADAVIRASQADLGVFALLVDAKDRNAELFYEHMGFCLLAPGGSRVILPIATALQAIERSH
jgi:GNAT superfamily N-acetyltransferase